MLWFKHFHNFRNSPQMKYIQRRLGSEGVAAAYRLLEVMCECVGRDDCEPGMLHLTGAYNEAWLADELGLYDEDYSQYGNSIDTKKLNQFLNAFVIAGFIELNKETVDGQQLSKDDDKLEPVKVTFTTVTVPGFVGLVDEYTRKTLSKGLKTPE